MFSLSSFSGSLLTQEKEDNKRYQVILKRSNEKIQSIDKADTQALILAHYDFLYEVKRDIYFSKSVVGTKPLQLISKNDLELHLSKGSITDKSKKDILTNLRKMKLHINLLVDNDLITANTLNPFLSMVEVVDNCESVFCFVPAMVVTSLSSVTQMLITLPFLPNLAISRNHVSNAEESIENSLRDSIPNLKERSSYKLFTEMSYDKNRATPN
jgi:hypothetical protein